MKEESDAMQEVMDIKEELWKEVENLPLDKAIRVRLESAAKIAQELGFTNEVLFSKKSVHKPL